MYTIETEACVFQVAAAYATCLAKGLKTYNENVDRDYPRMVW